MQAVIRFLRANPQVGVLLVICIVLGLGTFLAVIFAALDRADAIRRRASRVGRFSARKRRGTLCRRQWLWHAAPNRGVERPGVGTRSDAVGTVNYKGADPKQN